MSSEERRDRIASGALKRAYWEEYGEVFEKDGLDHEVYVDENDVLRWKPDPMVRWIMNRVDLNSFWYDGETVLSKNDPTVRELYRKMGYSVFGYWEIFFWEWNNEKAQEWKGDTASA